MQRDGTQISLWQTGSKVFSGTQTAAPKQVFDVIIVGGGMTGILTALQLQEKGLSCLVAEARNLCFGTTGGTTAHLNTALDTGYDRVAANFGEDGARLLHKATREALDLAARNVRHYNIDCGYAEKDAYIFAQDEKQEEKLDKIFKASFHAGADIEYADKIHLPIPFQKAIKFSRQAQFHPTEYVLGLAQHLEAAGGVVLQGCHVKDVLQDEVGLHIDTNLGTFRGNKLIYATHTPPGINLLHFRCAPYRSYVMAAILEEGIYPDALAYDMHDPYHYYRTHEVDGQQYLIGGGEDHKTAHITNTDACFNQLEAHLRSNFNVKEIAYRWSSQYFEPADGIAYIGQLPGHPENVYVATGYGGNGMTYSHIAAITLSDMIATGSSQYADLFRPGRVKPVAGFASFVQENADVVAQFIGKRFGTKKLSSLAGLAPGEGRVVKHEGQHIALYKDPGGKLYALNPVCSHAKCVVDWNSSERSWDCPCHGARYDINGDVLTGPSTKGLEPIDLSEED